VSKPRHIAFARAPLAPHKNHDRKAKCLNNRWDTYAAKAVPMLVGLTGRRHTLRWVIPIHSILGAGGFA